MTEADYRPTLPDHLVEDYCISEGWVKVPAGKTLSRKGQPLLIKLKGPVEAFYR
jgi:hypothetical protein